MGRIMLVLSIVVMCGCAPSYMWVKDNVTQSEVNQDVAYCRLEAQKATASYSGAPDIRRPLDKESQTG